MGNVASDILTSTFDTKRRGYKEDYGLLNLNVVSSIGDFHRVRICLKRGADPNERCFEEDDPFNREDTPMISAARGSAKGGSIRNQLRILKLINSHGGNPHLWNRFGQTALYVACGKGYLAIATWLIEQCHVNINVADKVGCTPLIASVRSNNAALVTYLLCQNAIIMKTKQFSHIETLDPLKETEDVNITRILNEAITGREKIKANLKIQMQVTVLKNKYKATLALKQQGLKKSRKKSGLNKLTQQRKEREMVASEANMAQELKSRMGSEGDNNNNQEVVRGHSAWRKMSDNQVSSTVPYISRWRLVASEASSTPTFTGVEWEEANKMMNSLSLRQKKLRPIQTAPESITRRMRSKTMMGGSVLPIRPATVSENNTLDMLDL